MRQWPRPPLRESHSVKGGAHGFKGDEGMKLKEFRYHAKAEHSLLSLGMTAMVELLADIDYEIKQAYQNGKDAANQQFDGPTLSAWVELREQVDRLEKKQGATEECVCLESRIGQIEKALGRLRESLGD